MAATAADIELTRRYQARLVELAKVVGEELARLWAQLESYDSHEEWRAVAEPIVTAAQGEAAALASGYVAAIADIPVPDVDVRVGPDLIDPFLAFARAIEQGVEFAEAVASGGSRAEAVGEGVVQWTARAATGQAAENVGGVVGWRRVLTGASCRWCQLISTQRYVSASSASFGHARCDCTVAPIIGDRDPGQVINDELLERLQDEGVVGEISRQQAARRRRT